RPPRRAAQRPTARSISSPAHCAAAHAPSPTPPIGGSHLGQTEGAGRDRDDASDSGGAAFCANAPGVTSAQTTATVAQPFTRINGIAPRARSEVHPQTPTQSDLEDADLEKSHIGENCVELGICWGGSAKLGTSCARRQVGRSGDGGP